jgi:hypothetical protein
MSADNGSTERRESGRPPVVVVVTGASAGIGRATVVAFGERGARVGLLARGRTGLTGAATDVERVGGRASPCPPTMVQMPAVNTPQFDWVLSRLPGHRQPVPPIYQPQIAAAAVVYAADHPRRREHRVGGSTAATLAANAVAPGLLDRDLARTGFDSRQTGDPPRDPHAPANLRGPADGDGDHGRDHGARGSFDGRSSDRSIQLWASQHHGALFAGAATAPCALTAAGAALLRRR